MLGLLLVFSGLLIVSMSFTPEEGEGMLPFFPFITSNGLGVIASILSVAFLSLFVIMSVLPWYMFMKRRRVQPHLNAFRWDTENRESEEMEYMITIKVPPGLEKTVYVEEDEMGSIDIYSHNDSTFHRTYDLPSGYEVAEYKYEYDGDYLVLRLKLKNSSDIF